MIPPQTYVLSALTVWVLLISGCTDEKQGARSMSDPTSGSVQHINPEGLHKNPAYSQAVVVSGAARTVYVGGQNAVDASGAVVGKGDMKTQAEQVINNVETALAAAGARLEHVIKWNVYVVNGQSLQPGFEVFQRAWGGRPNPPIVTVVYVSGLAQPDYLLEIEAVAVAPK
jgi:enamine deaminase RidA (YjgF/YER057c/UK114 family)